MDYKQKYIKYKIKLKNLFGGNYLIPLKNCSPPPIGKENISEKEKKKFIQELYKTI